MDRVTKRDEQRVATRLQDDEPSLRGASTPVRPPPSHVKSPAIQTSGCIGGVITVICVPVIPPIVIGSGPETTVTSGSPVM